MSAPVMASVRDQFPIFRNAEATGPWVYLDSGATTQKPATVIDRMTRFYRDEYATVHRGVYLKSQAATESCEAVRSQIQAFIHAAEAKEIIFTKGTTESINLVAHSFGMACIGPHQDILVSQMEHHSNIVPWQMVAGRTNAQLRVIPMDADGNLDMDAFSNLLSNRTALVAVNHVSNALGTVNDIATIIQKAHAVGAKVLIDGAQAVAHLPVDVQALDADFYVFSSHKLYGPTGLGVLYGKRALLEKMRPYQTGGDMIETVTFEETTFAPLPAKFEAGTPPIVETVGFGLALTFVQELGLDWILVHEADLIAYTLDSLQALGGITLIGRPTTRCGAVSFTVDGVHPHDVGTILDSEGVAVRVGHHCAQPVMAHFKVPATVRASFGCYNDRTDVDRLITALRKVKEVFG